MKGKKRSVAFAAALAVASVFLVEITGSAHQKPQPTREQILQEVMESYPEGKLRWRVHLRLECLKYRLPYRKMKAIFWLESRWRPGSVEYENGRKISFGIGQNHLDTCRLYRDNNGIKLPAGIDERQWAVDPYNSISVTCWNFRVQGMTPYRENFAKAMMIHNLGAAGAETYLREKGKLYWPYHSQDVDQEYFKKLLWGPNE